ncbi:kelch repeat protein, partial [Oesophagostomum dentatum]
MRFPRELAAATTMNDKIYVCGGSNGNEDLDTVECFDPCMNCWFSMPSMKVVRKNLSVLAYDSAVYAIAGENDSTALSSMEVYREGAGE